jgi:DNA-binding NtrC family response regulator
MAYSWPGNVRELINAIERAVSFASGEELLPENLPDSVRLGEQRSGALSKGSPRPRSAMSASDSGRVLLPDGIGSQTTQPTTAPLPLPAHPSSPSLPALPAISPQTDLPFKDAKELWVAAFERQYILSLLTKNRGNISHAAREAEIDRKYFRKLMRKYDIEGPRDEPLEEDD